MYIFCRFYEASAIRKPKITYFTRGPRSNLTTPKDSQPMISYRLASHPKPLGPIIILYLYLYSAQYLHVLQDSKRYITHSTVQVQFNSQVTDIPLTERQRLKDDHLSTSLRFFNLPLGIGPNDRGPPF